MLFNSSEFLWFILIFFSLYWLLGKKYKQQNILIVAASYFFYGFWDYRFLALILFSSVLDFFCGIKISKSSKPKLWLYLSLTANLGLLGFFKYFNFFIESFKNLSEALGFTANVSSLEIILPVGISFYTFQTLSYSIDVYKGKIPPSKNFIAFMAYVSFFPQLVAGPIERASHLLPQFLQKREFEYQKASEGMRLIIWGFFKKLVIADNCALFANEIFENYQQMHTISLILGSIYFAFQIYGDFSGYSDIAIGLSRLLGFDLMTNFRTPYFSRDIAEFWRRWHISLSTWFRDYLYIPLGGSQGSKSKVIRNIFIIFLVSGFWHGANWTFIAWGLINALYFLPLYLRERNRKNTGDISLKSLPKILITFGLVCFAWIFFRAESITIAFNYISSMFTNYNMESTSVFIGRKGLTILIFFFLLFEWFVFRHSDFQKRIKKMSLIARHLFYILVFYLILNDSVKQKVDFIYFQF